MIGYQPDEFVFVATTHSGTPIAAFEDAVSAGEWVDEMNAEGEFGCDYTLVPLKRRRSDAARRHTSE